MAKTKKKSKFQAKLAREGGGKQQGKQQQQSGGGRSTSPGRGYDAQGNLVGAAKAAKEGHLMGAAAKQHQAKVQREVRNKNLLQNKTNSKLRASDAEETVEQPDE